MNGHTRLVLIRDCLGLVYKNFEWGGGAFLICFCKEVEKARDGVRIRVLVSQSERTETEQRLARIRRRG